MSEDEGIKRSPRKHQRSVSASDAAKNIIKNKEPNKTKRTHPKICSDKDKTEVGKNGNDPKKPTTTPHRDTWAPW